LSLRDLDLFTFLDTSSANLFQDFFNPVLRQSIKYDRGVGFFSSGWLKLASDGMVEFAQNGGHARWVTSPILSKRDWDALQVGDEARTNSIIREALQKSVEDLAKALRDNTLSVLAWMVADNIIDFRIALPRNKLDQGDFHDKFGIFTDKEGNQISFNGSYNDSIQGTRNYESIKVFSSWQEPFKDLVSSDVLRFEKLWNNEDPNVQVFSLPDSIRKNIIRLRENQRPYLLPEHDPFSINIKPPSIPIWLTLRDYQKDALKAWFDNNNLGLFEMATGTGKTITALSASIQLLEEENRLAVIIVCPYQHLVDQWVDEAKNFGYLPIRAYKSRNTWVAPLREKVIFYNYKDINYLCVVTTHATFSTKHFQEIIKEISDPKLLIADEVHHLGSSNRRDFLPENYRNRLALSATPDRWYDDRGTLALRDYFGKTVFELTLSDAIGISLTPYYYYPVLVELDEYEMEEYKVLSKRIGILMAQGKDESDEYLTHLLIKRSRILNNAKNKITTLEDLINQEKTIQDTLIYCAAGGQIDEVMNLVGFQMRISAHRFTSEEDIATRRDLLERFASRELKVLAAMKCLDEGVDVPSTQTAYILASSSNPREFIQRRGRVLRKHAGKDHANIYDLITVPPPISQFDETTMRSERSILKRELKRFVEFADSANNTQSAYDVVWDLADKFNMLDALEEGITP
jgi:superfamily II DNA or RNA helicase